MWKELVVLRYGLTKFELAFMLGVMIVMGLATGFGVAHTQSQPAFQRTAIQNVGQEMWTHSGELSAYCDTQTWDRIYVYANSGTNGMRGGIAVVPKGCVGLK